MKYSVFILMAGCFKMVAVAQGGAGFFYPQDQFSRFDDQTSNFVPKGSFVNSYNHQHYNQLNQSNQPNQFSAQQTQGYGLPPFDLPQYGFATYDNNSSQGYGFPIVDNSFQGNNFNSINEMLNRLNQAKIEIELQKIKNNSERVYQFSAGRLFCKTDKGLEEIDKVDIFTNQNGPKLYEGEFCFYDKVNLDFILISQNNQLKRLKKTIPLNDPYRLFVFDEETSRYFYVVPKNSKFNILVPLVFVNEAKNNNGLSSLLKLENGDHDIVYKLIDGNMIFVGTYKKVNFDCILDQSGQVFVKADSLINQQQNRQINDFSNLSSNQAVYNRQSNQPIIIGQNKFNFVKDQSISPTVKHYMAQKSVSDLPIKSSQR